MTYISKKEKVFDLPEQDDTSSVTLNSSQHRLKRFLSVNDRRAWTSEECQKYQHFYGLINGRESNISKSSSFKYIPFDVLLTVLMAEKDAYIQELLLRQEKNSCCEDRLYKADGFEDSDDDRDALIRKDAEMVALKNKIAGLESELEDYRDTFTKAMHKLETIDSVMNENHFLREKLKHLEETIKCLEEKKLELEKELKLIKKPRGISTVTNNKEIYTEKNEVESWGAGETNEIIRLSSERNLLLSQVEELQKKLEKEKTNALEIEVLRKMSESTTSSMEELTRENESYKKKIETMKCLEKHIEDLKIQAHTLTEKYKKESQKASDQLKQINLNLKELQLMREERDKLKQRVDELASYESQYKSLQSKLLQIEMILDENEMLNKKLILLDRLELENEHLKIKIEQLQNAEIQAVEDKERIIQLQCAVVNREEEIRKMVKQLEELSQGYTDKNEMLRLRNELEEKNGKLKQYEKQLSEIPILESEIEDLRKKLQKCIDDFKTDKDLLKRLQEELEACQRRCHELEKMAPSSSNFQDQLIINEKEDECQQTDQDLITQIILKDEGENTEEILKEDVNTQCPIKEYMEKYSETTFSYFEKLEELNTLNEQNQLLHIEIENLKKNLAAIDFNDFLKQINEMKELLRQKDEKNMELESEILKLHEEIRRYDNVEELEKHLEDLEYETKSLKEINNLLKKEINMLQTEIKETNDLQKALREEKKIRKFAENLAKEVEMKLLGEKSKSEIVSKMLRLYKQEIYVAKREALLCFHNEEQYYKNLNNLFWQLINDLKIENNILREQKDCCNSLEKNALQDLLNKLRAEAAVLKNLSKPELEEKCEILHKEIKNILKETDYLIAEINNLKESLNSEQEAKYVLEKELINLQAELKSCLTAGNEILENEIATKDSVINDLQKEIFEHKHKLENIVNENRVIQDENINLINRYENLKLEYRNVEDQLTRLLTVTKKQNKLIKEQEGKQKEYLEKIDCVEKQINNYKKELEKSDDLEEELEARTKILKETLKSKEEELENLKKTYLETKVQLNMGKSEIEILKSRLCEKNATDVSEVNYEEDLKEKYALEEALRKIEEELDDLILKLSDCKKMEQEMVLLRSKRDFLLERMTEFEKEIDHLKTKLGSFENLKDELEKLKAEKISFDVKGNKNLPKNLSDLYDEVEQQKIEISKLKMENENLQEQLLKSENLLKVSKKLEKTVSQFQTVPSSIEFFTPPTLPSPHAADITQNEEDQATIPLKIHIEELAEVENNFKIQISKLKEANRKKVKKLTSYYEKDAKCRSKIFHDNINTMKVNYENDIRKLVEKHKISISKLQELHEDEVQELNTLYETQMEAMQTQNENVINDLKTESAEKYKNMEEQHNMEIKELEIKYKKIMKEKALLQELEEGNLEIEMINVENNSEIHVQTVEELTRFYQNSINDLEKKHSKEMKKCKINNLKKIELMKNKYEALLVEERKNYEEKLEDMLLQLKKGQQGGDHETNNFPPKRSSNPRLEFLEILQKIINEGLESLTFEELLIVHSKTCFLPENLVEECEGGIGDIGCKHKMLMASEKEELLKRIFVLEHELIIKQLETHEAIVNMEAAEKFRIQELKNALCDVQEKNAELKHLLSNQTKTQMDMKIEKYMMDKQVIMNETNVLEKIKELEKEKAEKKRLEEELQKEKSNVKHLNATLEYEKERFKSQRKRDSDYVESIRMRLEEALSHEHMMESQLDYEARFRAKLESELQALQKSFNLIADLPYTPTPVENKVVKDLRNFDQCEAAKEEIRKRSRSKNMTKLKAHNS